jgi:hypothetical protein
LAAIYLTLTAAAQDEPFSAEAGPAPAQDEPFTAEAGPAPEGPPAHEAPAPDATDALQELPLPPADAVVDAALEIRAQAVVEPLPGIGNEDVVEMAKAQFSEATMLAAIAANETRFDVAPRVLVALKTSGVPERVIEAMLAAETSKQQAAVAPLEQAEPAAAAQMSPEAFAKLSEMIERLAAQQQAAAAKPEAQREPAAPPSADPSPHAWISTGDNQVALAPTIAQVAFTDERGFGSNTMKTLQNLAGKALAFANPAYGIASTLSGMLRNDEENGTAVWALAGVAASRELGPKPVFEVEFGHIPGVDPDKYQPAIVQLVPTSDNYRLVAAAKAKGANSGAMPDGPIIEESVATELTRIARGRYRVSTTSALGAGEYALVLRPIARKERSGRRKSSEASLGELLGSGTSQVLYLTWDFCVRV